jgi:hypothetical protein
MITLEREPGTAYECITGEAELTDVAGRERLFPASWMATDPAGDMPAFRSWLQPLTTPVPALLSLPGPS